MVSQREPDQPLAAGGDQYVPIADISQIGVSGNLELTYQSRLFQIADVDYCDDPVDPVTGDQDISPHRGLSIKSGAIGNAVDRLFGSVLALAEWLKEGITPVAGDEGIFATGSVAAASHVWQQADGIGQVRWFVPAQVGHEGAPGTPGSADDGTINKPVAELSVINESAPATYVFRQRNFVRLGEIQNFIAAAPRMHDRELSIWFNLHLTNRPMTRI